MRYCEPMHDDQHVGDQSCRVPVMRRAQRVG